MPGIDEVPVVIVRQRMAAEERVSSIAQESVIIEDDRERVLTALAEEKSAVKAHSDYMKAQGFPGLHGIGK